MTIEEKAAELQAGSLNTKMMSQVDRTQVLIYQMEKLRAAYVETAGAAAQLNQAAVLPQGGAVWNVANAMTPGMPGGLTMPIGGAQMPKGGSPILGTNAWAGTTAQLIANSGNNMQKIAAETEKASKFSKVFNQHTLATVATTTALACLVTETGSGLSDWLNWISMISIGLTAVLPLVSGIGTK